MEQMGVNKKNGIEAAKEQADLRMSIIKTLEEALRDAFLLNKREGKYGILVNKAIEHTLEQNVKDTDYVELATQAANAAIFQLELIDMVDPELDASNAKLIADFRSRIVELFKKHNELGNL